MLTHRLLILHSVVSGHNVRPGIHLEPRFPMHTLAQILPLLFTANVHGSYDYCLHPNDACAVLDQTAAQLDH